MVVSVELPGVDRKGEGDYLCMEASYGAFDRHVTPRRCPRRTSRPRRGTVSSIRIHGASPCLVPRRVDLSGRDQGPGDVGTFGLPARAGDRSS
jgi:hypothetical protein